MEDKLEILRDNIINIEMDENDRNLLLMLIDDIERDIEIQNEAYDYLNDQDNYE